MKPFWLIGNEKKLWGILDGTERKAMWRSMIVGIAAIPFVAFGMFADSTFSLGFGALLILYAAWNYQEMLVRKTLK